MVSFGKEYELAREQALEKAYLERLSISQEYFAADWPKVIFRGTLVDAWRTIFNKTATRRPNLRIMVDILLNKKAKWLDYFTMALDTVSYDNNGNFNAIGTAVSTAYKTYTRLYPEQRARDNLSDILAREGLPEDYNAYYEFVYKFDKFNLEDDELYLAMVQGFKRTIEIIRTHICPIVKQARRQQITDMDALKVWRPEKFEKEVAETQRKVAAATKSLPNAKKWDRIMKIWSESCLLIKDTIETGIIKDDMK